jgi:hypothetical protein
MRDPTREAAQPVRYTNSPLITKPLPLARARILSPSVMLTRLAPAALCLVIALSWAPFHAQELQPDLRAKGVRFTEEEAPDVGHVWPYWRKNFAELATKVFQGSTSRR